ncbi:hypothetical protein FACS1894120_1050 [Clostridia bacterium]|nr:hypothetical protein FACS1894120_1050 [Clostridia bacterium]
MAKHFSTIINEIMPLVVDGDKSSPFVIFKKEDDTFGPWFVEYPNENSRSLKDIRETDPYAVSFTGMDFDGGSFAFVHDKVLVKRIQTEFSDLEFGVVKSDEYAAVLHFLEENIGALSQQATEYMLEQSESLYAIYDLLPIRLKSVDGDYDHDKINEALEIIENAVDDNITADLNKQTQRDIDAMLENGEIGGDDKIGEEFLNRLRDECFNVTLSFPAGNDRYSNDDKERLRALMNFLEYNIGEFSQKTIDYLAKFDEPFRVIDEFCPYNLVTDNSDWTFNRSLAADAVDHIERKIEEIINRPKDVQAEKINDVYDTKRIISSLNINGVDISLGEDTEQEQSYYVDISKNGECIFGMQTENYPEAIKAYAEQITEQAYAASLDRNNTAFMSGVKYVKLTDVHCLPGSKDEDFKGKLVIADPNALLPEYRSSTSQIIECSHGNGCSPTAIGRSVFGTELYSGKLVTYDRSNILGICDESKLPQWAKTKLRIVENKKMKEYGNVIDTAIQEGVTQKSIPHTLEILDARFGKEKTNELLATIALTTLKDDGRISSGGRKWAESILGDTDNIRNISIKSHPAHFDNLLMYAAKRMKVQEQEKSSESKSILDRLDEKNKLVREQEKAKPKRTKKKSKGEELE